MNHLIIGGAGFIGSNLVAHLLLDPKNKIWVIDNLSRNGTEKNLKWLRSLGGDFHFGKVDIVNDFNMLCKFVEDADRIYHLAAQVAVTSSVTDPRTDFNINALGTFNVLEAVRLHGKKDTRLIFSSTNKVYGGMDDVEVVEKKDRYVYKRFPNGINEEMCLDFHSPYGCSKGCGDQYVRDYSRIYGLNTVVFRQSCIYGPRQFGVEDQGWVAWFIIAITLNKNLTIYGDGKQVRDILYVSDLVRAYQLALDNIKLTKGQVFNIGGGSKNQISIWENFRTILEKLFDKKINVSYSDWRPGDQKIYVSDYSKAKNFFNWEPEISPENGIEKLFRWVKENKILFN